MSSSTRYKVANLQYVIPSMVVWPVILQLKWLTESGIAMAVYAASYSITGSGMKAGDRDRGNR